MNVLLQFYFYFRFARLRPKWLLEYANLRRCQSNHLVKNKFPTVMYACMYIFLNLYNLLKIYVDLAFILR